MTEVANIYPTDIKRHPISPKDRSAVATVRGAAYGVCRTQIDDGYIHNAFNTFKEGFVYMQGSQIISFCIWKENVELTMQGRYAAELYIFLVCSVKQPYSAIDMILFDLDRHCRQKGITAISLEPANDELREYYRSKGFVNGNGANPKRMYRPVATTNVYRRRNTTRKADRHDVLGPLTVGADTNISPNNLNII
jgi:hypothetical protein